ncbi:374_t:CDS:2 [Funneliformis geosporum]|uniref:374_t:CDS:1 n=1 Tax=Funneliformis geosporum TaxID=1117311 RepID=A0A9W4X5P0_9GLOM|nr:374_t:CDS:2 [Funneliformis geosporum]
MNDEPSEENPSNIHSDDDNISIAFTTYCDQRFLHDGSTDTSNFRHEELSDEDSDTDDDENLELDIPEQPIRNHHRTRSITTITLPL